MRFFIVCIVILLSTASCYKRIEGCLDVLSSNYNPNADDPCAECCTNPILKLSIRHQLDSSFYSANDTVVNNLGQSFKILDFAYFLSRFQPKSFSGETIEGLRKIEVVSGLIQYELPDNFILVRPDVFDYHINEIRQNGHFDQLEFIVGLSDNIRSADSILVSQDHILSDSLYLRDENHNKLWGYISFVKGDQFSDTIQLNFNISEMEIPVTIEKSIQNSVGTDLNYIMIVNYAAWFKNVNVDLPVTQIKSAIKANLPNSFSVE